jgi:oxalate decarboxylase
LATSSPHVRSLREAEVQHASDAGEIRRLTKDAFPILERISIKRLVIEPGCLREPHWHANADELTYCLRGEVLVSVLDNADVFGAFTIGAGEMFHIDSGALHHIENVGDAAAELLVVFSHESPRDFSIPAPSGR